MFFVGSFTKRRAEKWEVLSSRCMQIKEDEVCIKRDVVNGIRMLDKVCLRNVK